MRYEGQLHSWNDDKGFGFIAPRGGGREVFVHISAFARDGSRPTLGESLTYELGSGKNGKPQAINVTRRAIGSSSVKRTLKPSKNSRRSLVGVLVSTAFVIVAGAVVFKQFQAHRNRANLDSGQSLPAVGTPHDVSPASFVCDGRLHCSQMSSCTEAKWFLKNCPGTLMDGDNDGVPCEQQLCTSVFSK